MAVLRLLGHDMQGLRCECLPTAVRGERRDGRDAVQVAVQQRVAGADNADEADDGDEAALCAGDDSRGRR